ncbi:MAG: hypothetical protein AB7O91_02545 [Sphingomonas sp.]
MLFIALGAAPAAAQIGDGMGAFPQVVQGPGGTLQAIYHQNGCTITYDARTGQQLTSRSACTSAQRNYADLAIADQRRAARFDPRPDGSGRYGRAFRGGRERPTIGTDLNGNPSASFRSPVCVVYYRRDGRRTGSTQYCTRAQIRRAEDEMDLWLEAQPR